MYFPRIALAVAACRPQRTDDPALLFGLLGQTVAKQLRTKNERITRIAPGESKREKVKERKSDDKSSHSKGDAVLLAPLLDLGGFGGIGTGGG
jgi:hypothetical protein